MDRPSLADDGFSGVTPSKKLTVGTKKGEGLMRRLTVSKDPTVMLNSALQEAAKAAGVELKLTETEILIAT